MNGFEEIQAGSREFLVANDLVAGTEGVREDSQ
jgi:hypothetical protein